MRARLPLAVLFAFALATFAASSASAQPCAPGSTPSECNVSQSTLSMSASSGGCFPPSLAVDNYFEAASESPALDLGPGEPDDCEKICDKFVDTCDDIAKIAKDCHIRGGGEFAELSRAVCQSLEDKQDRRGCKNEINFVRGEVRDCVRADRHRAAGCCENYRAACLADCGDSWFPPTQLCFTGPGGYAGGTCFFNLANVPF